MSVSSCLLKHFGDKSPVAAYRADMAEDVAELVADGMTADAAWLQVTQAKLDELSAERARIEQDVADAYAKTPAGKSSATKPAETPPTSAPAEASSSKVDPATSQRIAVLNKLLECLTK